MNEIERQVNYLLSNEYHIPVYRNISNYKHQSQPYECIQEKISVKEVLYSLVHKINTLNKENSELKKDFVEFIEISSQFSFWGNERRQDLMNQYGEKYRMSFPLFCKTKKQENNP